MSPSPLGFPFRSPLGFPFRSPLGVRGAGEWRLARATLTIVHGATAGANLRPRLSLVQEYADCAEMTTFFGSAQLDALVEAIRADAPAADWPELHFVDCSNPAGVVVTDTPTVHPGWGMPTPHDIWHATVVQAAHYMVWGATSSEAVNDPTGVQQFVAYPGAEVGLGLRMDSNVPLEERTETSGSVVVYYEHEFNSGDGSVLNRYMYATIPASGGADEPDKLTPPGIVLFADGVPLCVFTLPAGLLVRHVEPPFNPTTGAGRAFGLFVCGLELEINRG